jgi:hypothetical protein
MKQLFKFAGAVLDCYDDPSFIGSPMAQDHFGKTLVSPEKVSELPDSAFAVKIASRTGYQRRFPLYNETAVKTSQHYFEMVYNDLPEEIQKAAGYNLAVACDKYGVTKSETLAKHAGVEASPIVEMVTESTSEVRIGQDDLTKQAEFSLACELPKMVLENRTYAATEFHKLAGDGMTRQDVWDYVAKPVTGPLLDGACDDREALLKRASTEKQYMFAELRSSFEDMAADRVVESLLTFDKLAGFDGRYRDGMTDPYMAVYGGWPTPAARQETENRRLEKEAALVDGQTGQQVPADTAKGLSVEQHLFNLRTSYPKGSSEFQKAASSPTSENMIQNYGANYGKARKMYFGA